MMAKRAFYSAGAVMLLFIAWHLGSLTAAASPQTVDPTEVVVAQGTVGDGGLIPLPVYADGTTASEAECRWIVSPANVPPDYRTNPISSVVCFTTGRHVVCNAYDTKGAYSVSGIANYLVIATRHIGATTTARAKTWGAVKAKALAK